MGSTRAVNDHDQMKRDPKTDGLVAGKGERKLKGQLVERRLLRTRWIRLDKAPQPVGPSCSANSHVSRRRSVAVCLARFSNRITNVGRFAIQQTLDDGSFLGLR